MSMNYTVVSFAEFTYPDVAEYSSSSKKADAFGVRGSYAPFQVILSGLEGDGGRIDAQLTGLPDGCTAELYSLVSIPVERNESIAPDSYRPHYPERVAPYRVYDCLKPFDGSVEVSESGIAGLYAAIRIDQSAAPGDYECTLHVNGALIPVSLKVYAARLPEETLKIICGYSRRAVADKHGTSEGSEEFRRLDKQYLAMLRRMHQNMMYTMSPHAVRRENNQWEFDFSDFIQQIKDYEAAGMRYFNVSGIGFRRSWSESTIIVNGMPAMSYEAYCYLSQYLPQLVKVLREHNWLDRFVIGVADEPNAANWTEYRALCGMVRKIAPELRLIDAMSHGELYGALDIWVPLNAEYDRHRDELEMLRANGDEIWHYVCCAPREPGYINRFMDYPLLSTRYLHWGNYKYNLTGYLHWAVNCYQPGQDPFLQSCPEHHNADSICFLPAGDTHIMYPGDGEPWMSIRLEAERAGAEEYELLRLLAEHNKPLADELCNEVFHSFGSVEYNVAKFEDTAKRLYSAVSELQD